MGGEGAGVWGVEVVGLERGREVGALLALVVRSRARVRRRHRSWHHGSEELSMQNLAVAAQAVVESVGPRSFLNPSRQEACTVDLVASVCVCRADEGYQPKDHSWCTVRVDSQFHFLFTKCAGCAGEWKHWKVYRVRVLFNEALLMRRPFLFVLYLGMAKKKKKVQR